MFQLFETSKNLRRSTRNARKFKAFWLLKPLYVWSKPKYGTGHFDAKKKNETEHFDVAKLGPDIDAAKTGTGYFAKQPGLHITPQQNSVPE